MTDYVYNRFLKEDGTWNINNPYDVNEIGESVPLIKRVQDAFPEKHADNISLNDKEAIITMDDLTPEEKVNLDLVVAQHETAAGTINYTSHIHLVDANNVQWALYVDTQGNLHTTLDID